MAALQKWHIPGEASGVPEDPDATRAQPRLGPDVEGHHPDTQRNSTVTTTPGCEVGTVIIPPLHLGKMRLKQEKIVKSGVKNVSCPTLVGSNPGSLTFQLCVLGQAP